jgi:WD40 repeat protein
VNVNWPSPNDYQEAIQSPRVCFKMPDLKAGTVVCTNLGLPRVASGNFASVYKITNGSQAWAVRCFLRQVSDQQRRYSLLSNHLQGRYLSTLVGFEYIIEGILVKGRWYPIVKMDWVEGEPLHAYVKQRLNDKRALDDLVKQWRGQVVGSLRGNHLAHGDLQHGNVLVTPQGMMRLVDYDAMYVPRLSGEPSPELGHANFQHPGRTPDDYDQELDNFAGLIIYTSLRALKEDPNLWQQFHNGDNLILASSDYKDPRHSKSFQLLKKNSDPVVKNLAGQLEHYCQDDVSNVPGLEDAINEAEGSGQIKKTKTQKPTQTAPASKGSGRAKKGKTQPAIQTATQTATQPGTHGAPGWLSGQGTQQAKPSTPPPAPVQATSQTVSAPATKPPRWARIAALVLVVLVAAALAAYFIKIGPGDLSSNLAELAILSGHQGEVNSVAFSSDGKIMASGGADSKALLWDTDTWKSRPGSLAGHSDEVLSVAFSPDAKLLATASKDTNIALWDTQTGKWIRQLPRHHSRAVRSLAFSDDGKMLVSGGEDGLIVLYNAETFGYITQLIAGSPVYCVAISAGGDLIASGTLDGTLTLWEAQSSTHAQRLRKTLGSPVNSVAFSPDGKLVACGVGNEKGSVKIYDVETGAEKQSLSYGSVVNSVAFHPGGKVILAAGSGLKIMIWDIATGKEAGMAIRWHTRMAKSVAVSTDGTKVVFGCADNLARVWGPPASK